MFSLNLIRATILTKAVPTQLLLLKAVVICWKPCAYLSCRTVRKGELRTALGEHCAVIFATNFGPRHALCYLLVTLCTAKASLVTPSTWSVCKNGKHSRTQVTSLMRAVLSNKGAA
eukprot:6185249-Pleurochrysis_carterae.AAC.1